MSDKATLIERLREEAKAMQNELEKSDSTGWPVSIVAGLLGVARIEKEAADVIESQAADIENLETGNAILVDMVHRADAEIARLKEELGRFQNIGMMFQAPAQPSGPLHNICKHGYIKACPVCDATKDKS